MNPTEWIILTAPSDLAVHQGEALEGLTVRLRSRIPRTEIRHAVLTGTGPTITEVLDEARRTGVGVVTVLYTQTVEDRSTAAWFRRVISHWLRQAGTGRAPRIRLAPPLTGTAALADLLVAAREEAAEFTPTGAPLLSPAWLAPPDFTHHLLLCGGTRCSALGSAASSARVHRALDRHGIADDVLVTTTGCLFPCSRGPVAVVYPSGTWYQLAGEEAVDQIVEGHLVGGAPVRERSFFPRPAAPAADDARRTPPPRSPAGR